MVESAIAFSSSRATRLKAGWSGEAALGHHPGKGQVTNKNNPKNME
jgi:hypothetical protein